MNLSIVRHAYLSSATLGRLFVGDAVFATLEEPWHPDPDGPGGQRREAGKPESCVPDGSYVLEPHDTPRYRNVWALINPRLGVYHWAVPPGLPYGRTAILMHAGNTADDTQGCILVGMAHSRLDGKEAVLASRQAIEQLRSILGAELHELTIRPTSGTSEVTHGR